MAYILASMEAVEMAKIIFHQFDVLQSCKIEGFEFQGTTVKPKGELVCDALWELDRIHNCYIKGQTLTRKKVKPKNSIGGFAAQKIFQYEIFINGDHVKYTIWRIQ